MARNPASGKRPSRASRVVSDPFKGKIENRDQPIAISAFNQLGFVVTRNTILRGDLAKWIKLNATPVWVQGFGVDGVGVITVRRDPTGRPTTVRHMVNQQFVTTPIGSL